MGLLQLVVGVLCRMIVILVILLDLLDILVEAMHKRSGCLKLYLFLLLGGLPSSFSLWPLAHETFHIRILVFNGFIEAKVENCLQNKSG